MNAKSIKAKSINARSIKALYKEIYSNDYIETGPRLVAASRGKYISQKRLFAVGEPFAKDVSFKQGHRIIDVPTAWHALCVAMYLQHRSLAEDQSHLVFRGQTNSSYPLVASIFRPTAEPEHLERAKQLLAWFLAGNSGLQIGTDPTLFYGAAQHYQIWTNLLDITPDPAVAVWFAASPTKEKHPAASVYVFSLDAAERMGTNLRLPPPYIERLHRQRGIFIECKSAEPLPMDEVVEIHFPANINGKYSFDVIRHGKSVDILEDHSWIRKVVTWAKKTAADSSMAIPTAVPDKLDGDFALFLKAVKAASIPEELLDKSNAQERLFRWLDQFNDALYWLAYRWDDTNKGAEELLEPRYVRRLVESNSLVASKYVETGRQLGMHRDPAFHAQLDIIEDAIRNSKKKP